MRKSIVTFFASCLVGLIMAGCSASNPMGTGDDDAASDDDDGGTTNTFHFDGGNYSVPHGTEGYHCFFRDFATGATSTEKVGAIKFGYTPASAVLHHIVIFSAAASEGDTERDCELLEDGWNPRYAGGTVTDPLETPAGVAMPVGEVEHIVIQFHYLNAGEADVVDNTTVDIDFTKPGTPFIAGSLIVSGNTDFTVPPSPLGVNYPVIGDCTVPAQLPFELTVFAVWPHMHQTGTWFSIEATVGGEQRTLWDQAWNFGDQPLTKLSPPLLISGGDSVHTVCSYTNPSDTTEITYGESSTQEMCFDFFYYYPSLFSGTYPCLE